MAPCCTLGVVRTGRVLRQRGSCAAKAHEVHRSGSPTLRLGRIADVEVAYHLEVKHGTLSV